MTSLPDDVRTLLQAPNFVHLATLMPDGSPHCVAVWADLEGEDIVFFTQSQSQKARNLARDPRVAISLVDRDNPYRMARLRGRLSRTVEGDAALEIIDRISHKYTGAAFPMRSGVVFVVEAERAASMELPFSDQPA